MRSRLLVLAVGTVFTSFGDRASSGAVMKEERIIAKTAQTVVTHSTLSGELPSNSLHIRCPL